MVTLIFSLVFKQNLQSCCRYSKRKSLSNSWKEFYFRLNKFWQLIKFSILFGALDRFLQTMKNKDIGVSIRKLAKMFEKNGFNLDRTIILHKNLWKKLDWRKAVWREHSLEVYQLILSLSIGMNKNFNQNINSIIWMVNVINKLSLSELLIVTTFCDLTLE